MIAKGPGKRLKDGNFAGMDIAVGDVVLFGKYAGTEFKSKLGTVLILREDDIMGTII